MLLTLDPGRLSVCSLCLERQGVPHNRSSPWLRSSRYLRAQNATFDSKPKQHLGKESISGSLQLLNVPKRKLLANYVHSSVTLSASRVGPLALRPREGARYFQEGEVGKRYYTGTTIFSLQDKMFIGSRMKF